MIIEFHSDSLNPGSVLYDKFHTALESNIETILTELHMSQEAIERLIISDPRHYGAAIAPYRDEVNTGLAKKFH